MKNLFLYSSTIDWAIFSVIENFLILMNELSALPTEKLFITFLYFISSILSETFICKNILSIFIGTCNFSKKIHVSNI